VGQPSLETLLDEARSEIVAAETLQALVGIRARYLGRKGSLSAMLRGIGELSPEERGRVG
jgi:phenylalanyl-tRNA synthetase alpha chain